PNPVFMRNSLPYRRPSPGPTCFFLARRGGARETTTEEAHGPHQGSQAGSDLEARPQRDRHGLAGGADRNAHAAHQRVDGASAHAPPRPLLAPRALEARRPPPPLLV